MQAQQEVTPQSFAQNMGGLKRRISQTAGETQQMSSDVMSQTLEQVMNMTNQIFQQVNQRDKKISEISAKLEKCYTAHPELKITIEADEKTKSQKANKGVARKV